jgi:NAD(P)-dependent dehydrogenase (short-subunit alcohol dehydrogenase family)
MSHQQQTVVITGAAGGMGRTICRHLAAGGWQVVAIDHNVGRLTALAESLPSIHALQADLTDPDLSEQLLSHLAAMPPVAGLVNLAGLSTGNTIDHLDDDAWDLSFAVNVTPAMRLTRALAPGMRNRKEGSIINVGSPVGLIGARKPSYAASKAALLGLTMSCARNLGADGIRVNMLLPGPTITEMTGDWSEERRQEIAQNSFLKRLCTPDEIAAVISFLLGPDSRYMTGSVVDMTAGSMWGH